MQIWIVLTHSYYGDPVYQGAFSSKEKAEEFKKTLKYIGQVDIHPDTMDDPQEPQGFDG